VTPSDREKWLKAVFEELSKRLGREPGWCYSPADYHLAEGWCSKGLPLPAVLQGIRETGGAPRSLQACKGAVEANVALRYFENFCHSNGLASKSYLSFGTDPIDGFVDLCARVRQDFPNCIFFTSKLIFEHDNFFIRLLHNQAALVLQQRLHLADMQMVILPLKVEV